MKAILERPPSHWPMGGNWGKGQGCPISLKASREGATLIGWLVGWLSCLPGFTNHPMMICWLCWLVGWLVDGFIPLVAGWRLDHGRTVAKRPISWVVCADRLLHRLVAKVFRPRQVQQVDLPKVQRVTWLLLAVGCTWGWGYTLQIIP